jgi:hypothetical protein
MFDLNPKELRVLKRLRTPQKIQDFLNREIRMNFELDGDTLMSPRRVLRERKAHCLEGAFLAAAALWLHGNEPLLLDVTSTKNDFDHVVALFKKHGRWGAISKTNHAVLRYREPVYRSYGELAMSYFHEYFMYDGKKTMRTYSKPFNLKKFGYAWVTSEENLWDLGDALDDSPHIQVLTPAIIHSLRKADAIEIKAGKLLEEKG